MENEVLINLFPKTDFEKLLFAERYIKELKESLRLVRIENGKLQSEIEELKSLSEITKSERKADNREVRKQIRKEEIYQVKERRIAYLEKEVDKLRADKYILLNQILTKNTDE